MVRNVQLDEDKHFVKMMHSVKQMKQEEDHCDFTIKVGGLEYQAHKVILSAGSPYFKAMLKHDTKESQERQVIMKDVDCECVKSCIDFIYSGGFEIPDGKTKHLLHVAIMMQLEDVKDAICNILDKELNVKNFYETKSITEMYNLGTLTAKCKEYFEEYLMAISAQPGFINENKSDIFDILKSKKLTEEEKVTVSFRWVGNTHEKNDVLLELLNLIRIKEVSSGYLCDLLNNHPLVCNDFRLYKMINAPLVTSLVRQESPDKARIILFDEKSDCLQSYNLVTDEIMKFHDGKFKYLGCVNVVAMDSYIYVLCANGSVYRLNFRDKNWKWEKMQDMIADHGDVPPSVFLSGSLFLIGSCASPTKDVEIFIPVVNQWKKLEDKPAGVGLHTLVSLDDSIYCIGGIDGAQIGTPFCRFTPLTSEWVDLEPMKNERYWCGAVGIQKMIFVIGGFRGMPALRTNDVECYDVTFGQWTSLSPMIESHGSSNAHHFNGWIFLVDRNGGSNNVEKYDIANDRWFKVEFKDVERFEVSTSVSIQI